MRIEWEDGDLDILKRAFDKWGNAKQCGMAMEELCETAVEVNHFERGREDTIDKVLHEFADAVVCVGQVLHSEDVLEHLEDATNIAIGKLSRKLRMDDHNEVEGRDG